MMTVKEVEYLKSILIEDQETIRTMADVLEDALERIERLEERVKRKVKKPEKRVLTLDPTPSIGGVQELTR